MFSRRRDLDTGRIDEKPKFLSHLTSYSWRSFSRKSELHETDSAFTHSRDWIKGVVICSWVIGSVLTLNIILTIIAAGIAYSRNGETDFAFASLYMGKCSVAKNWSTGLHLIINILSTAMLGASNYCMQCLASPSRAQVDEAHEKRVWVKIGIPNIWNLLRWQRGKRQVLGWILIITSLPIHLIYNSAVYFSLGPMEYTVLSGHAGSINGNHSTDFEKCFLQNAGVELPFYNAAIDESQFKTMSKQECIDTFAQDYVSGQRMVVLVTNSSMSEGEPMSWIGRGNAKSFDDKSGSSFSWLCNYEYDCGKSKVEQMTADWTARGFEWWNPRMHVEIPTSPGETYLSKGWLTIGHYGIPNTPDTQRLNDLLEQDPTVEQLQAQLDDRSNWPNASFIDNVKIHGYEPRCIISDQQSDRSGETYLVDHCMTLTTEETCQLFFSPPICIIVIGCNIIKLICTLFTARDTREDVFLTIGDAIASFLTRPDFTTAGSCLMSKPLVDKRTQGWKKRLRKKEEQMDINNNQKTLPLRLLPRKRWFQAASLTRWVCTITIFVLMLIPAIYVLRLGILDFNEAYGSQSIWDSGLGDPSAATILSGLDMEATTNGIFSMILMANTPQILVSIAYFMYNGLLTCMLSAVEYDNYATKKKPLRVSWPRGQQRSTYYLSLPYRYSLPLLAVSAVLHWLVSQSLFFVEIIPFDQNGTREIGDEVVTCGYSPVAIIFAIVVGGCLLLASILLGLRPFRSHMPLAAQCSAAISAACHPGTSTSTLDDVDDALKPVQWEDGIDSSRGAEFGSDDRREMLAGTTLDNEPEMHWSGAMESGYYHCSFTSEEVFEPSMGKVYI
ncbi:hypothetical protein BJY04DRAFT_226567 [Aspergillus karnatakaensis]|uniref:uncharacterized protein n=1 Tax=Aspergillus karnatakaensis TaxID=1810916 RepID=UPI003CCCDBE1